jgi:endo-1,4-beta-xylanase
MRIRWAHGFALLALSCALGACGGTEGTGTPSDGSSITAGELRQAAQAANFHWGAAVNADVLGAEPEYDRALAGNFTLMTPENVLKFAVIHPEPGRYDFSQGDRLAEFARRHGLKMRGHVLIWHEQLPDWVRNGSFTREELIEVMREHIHTVLGHYRRHYADVFIHWDVVNEAILADGSRRQSIWQRVIGDDYLELAFRFAREAWPELTLYYNDFEEFNFVLLDIPFDAGGRPDPTLQPVGTGAIPEVGDCETSTKCRGMRALITDLVGRGVPVDGVGFQAHVASLLSPDYRALTRWVEDLGLQWALTELDAPCGNDALAAGNEAFCFENQARIFGAAVQACVDSPACDTVVQWGVGDRHSFWNAAAGGLFTNPLALDQDYQYKPAAHAVVAALRSGQ